MSIKNSTERQHKISFIAITKFILYRASGNKLRYEIASMYREIEISPILTEYKLKYIFPISKYKLVLITFLSKLIHKL